MEDRSPWLLVGLGNPGREYAHNRHNVGFMVVERWLDDHLPPGSSAPWREKFHARTATASVAGQRVVVLQPQTFMNRSGKSVVAATQFHRVPPGQVLVVHDELDFPPGRLAIKLGGGHGGHNGLRDIIAQSGNSEFVRIRVGIGRPLRGGDVSRWVLTDFDPHDTAMLPDVVDRAARAATAVIRDGVRSAMNAFNQSSPPSGPAAIP
ncbi:aminoacyl-tRNA hydrolase [Paraliomyxa miuraensis]|uniref:aminoacyl-tRNA hydrolase n=1 Tax=Paraliomyxa miuraensis TaxID=376150 RepID=UPI002255856D|nr:aminoacyl-tRNA hydrolase [Paraliomyxa miuraensis]MCX4247625.1 aminoacyl-tRNA hydrolase [Paraliomyxa miuraensis]